MPPGDAPDDDGAPGEVPPPSASPPPPEATEAAEPAKRSRKRLVAIAGVIAIALAAGIVVLAIAVGRRGEGGPLASGSGGSVGGGGALFVPTKPALPEGPDSGIHLTGFVVDGAGLPVAGAEVAAELERSPLAPATTAGTHPAGSGSSGSGSESASHVASGSGSMSGSGSGSMSGSGSGSGSGSMSGSGSGSMSGSGSAAASGVGAGSDGPSGADGHFTIKNLVAGRYRVRVTGPGLLAAEVRFVPVPSDAARLVVARQVAIAGTVTDGGRPVADAHVGLRGDAIGGGIEATTDVTGHFSFDQLPEGRYQLYAWQVALAARTIRVARLGAGPFGPVELPLEAGAIVVGRVIDREEGIGLPAAVELRPVGDDQAPRYARTADDGTFKIEGVPTGRWIADAFSPGYTSPGGVELVAGKDIPELALVRGAAIEGRVVDGDGAPIAGAAVRALTAGASPTEISEAVERDHLRRYSGRTVAPAPATQNFAGDPQLIPRGELGVMVGPIPPLPQPGTDIARTAAVLEATAAALGLAGEPPPLVVAGVDAARASVWTTGADGKFRIVGAPKGKLTVLAAAPGFAEGASKPIAITEPSQVETGVEIVLTAGTFIVGTARDQHGLAVVGAQIQVAEQAVFTDGDGAYRIGPFAGRIELRASAYGHGDARETRDLAPVHGAAAAEERVDFVLPVADSEITGIVEDATGATVPTAEIEVIDAERHAIAGADGTFAIDMLPAGPVRLRITHPQYPALEVAATAGDGKAQLRIRLPLGGAVEGALIDDASGAPLPSVTIDGAGPDRATAEAVTDVKGRFTLGPIAPGTWKLTVKQAGYLAIAKDLDVPASRAPGASSVRDVLLALAKGAVVGGTVRDGRGTRIAGARVAVGAVTGETDAQGEFRLRDCPTGEEDVTADKGDLHGSTHRALRPGDEALGLSIELR